jgi:hypothetical protein
VPVVVIEVAERLASLQPDQQELAMPIVQSITEAVHQLSALRMSQAPVWEVAAAEQKLDQLVVQLFEAIGLELDEEKMRQFVGAIAGPEFARHLNRREGVWLEGVGTREVKRRFKEFFAWLVSLLTEVPARHLLGMFAVFHAGPRLQANVWA